MGRHSFSKKVCATTMSVVMAASFTPVVAFAEDGTGGQGSSAIEQPAEGKIDLGQAKITLGAEGLDSATGTYTYTGQAIKPSVMVQVDGKTLSESTDYTVHYQKGPNYSSGTSDDSCIDGGQYQVTVVAAGSNYTGMTSADYYIYDSNDFEHAHAELDKRCYAYTGNPIKPNVTVQIQQDPQVTSHDGRWLDIRFNSSKRIDISKCDATYTRVFYGENGSRQEEKVESPAEKGTYMVTVSAKENSGYKGSTIAFFDIVDEHDLSGGYLSYRQSRHVHTGQVLDFGFSVTDVNGETVDPSGYTLSYKLLDDQTGDWQSVTELKEVGYYEVSAAGKNSYTGETPSMSVVIVDEHDLNNAYISLDRRIVATGAAISLKDQLAVKNADDGVIPATGYELSYEKLDSESGKWKKIDAAEVKDPGEYRVTGTGKDSYSGSCQREFQILAGNDLGLGHVQRRGERHVADGNAYTPTIVVKDKDDKVVDSANYDVSYKKWDEETQSWEGVSTPIEAGRYEVIVAGKGEYTGAQSSSFEIYAANDLCVANFRLDNHQYVLKDGKVTPSVTLTDAKGETIPESAYQLVYSKNEQQQDGSYYPVELSSGEITKPGEYFVRAVAIDGDGYVGETGTGFHVYAANDLEAGTLTLGEDRYVANNSAVELKGMTLKDANGEPVPTDDYSLSYRKWNEKTEEWEDTGAEAPKEPGKYQVVAKGQNDHTGSISTWFRIVAANDLQLARIQTDAHHSVGNPLADIEVLGSDGKAISADSYQLVYYRHVADETGRYDSKKIAPSDIKEPGEYSVKAVAKTGGSYTGETYEQAFRVLADNDLAWASFGLNKRDYACTGNPVTPDVVLKDAQGNPIDSSQYDLVYYKDVPTGYGGFRLERIDKGDVKDPGEYRVKAVAKEGGSYTGETNYEWFRIFDTKNLESGHIGLSSWQVVKTASGVSLPTVSVYAYGVEDPLPQEAYDLTYEKVTESEEGEPTYEPVAVEDITEPGEYRVTANAKENSGYTGSASTVFHIYKGADLSGASLVAGTDDTYFDEGNYPYTGEKIVPQFAVRDIEGKTVDPSNYEVIYGRYAADEDEYVPVDADNLIEPGEYRVTVTARENTGYTGSTNAYFSIVTESADQAAADVVEVLIEKLPTAVTTDAQQSQIATAKNAYDGLTAAQKNLVAKQSVAKLDAAVAAAKAYADSKQPSQPSNPTQPTQPTQPAKPDMSAADKVAAAIAALPAEITTDAQAQQVSDARAAYDALADEQKRLVSADSLAKLANAEKAVQTYRADKAKAAEVEVLIAKLPASVASDDEQAQVEAAQAAYDALTASQKKLVGADSASKLSTAKAAADEYAKQKKTAEEKKAADKKAADEVVALIAALPASVETDAQAKQITAARAAYEALTADQAELAKGSLAALEAAEKSAAGYQEAAKKKAEKEKTAEKKAKQEAIKRAETVTLDKKTLTSNEVMKAVKKALSSNKRVKNFVIGTKVKVLPKKLFAGYKNVRTLVIKSKKLTKKSVKDALKGSKVATVRIDVGNAKADKKYLKKYKKVFTKSNVGKKVKVVR